MKCIILRIFFFLCCLCLLQPAAFALHKSVDESEINIGGVGIGANLDYVEQIYGAPESKEIFKNYMGNGVIYNYNNLFLVSAIYTKNNDTYVDWITCKEGNLKTPSGFAVGTAYTNVLKKYGKVPPLPADHVTHYKKEYQYYEYRCGAMGIIFAVDIKDIIQEIRCYIDI